MIDKRNKCVINEFFSLFLVSFSSPNYNSYHRKSSPERLQVKNENLAARMRLWRVRVVAEVQVLVLTQRITVARQRWHDKIWLVFIWNYTNFCFFQTCFVQVRKKEPPHPIRVAKTIDVIARITFPTAYSVFLIFFFIHYKGFS